METNSRIKTINVHTLVIDDTEIEQYLTNPDPLLDTLRDLLVAKPAPSPVSKAKRGKAGEGVQCQLCNRSFRSTAWLNKRIAKEHKADFAPTD